MKVYSPVNRIRTFIIQLIEMVLIILLFERVKWMDVFSLSRYAGFLLRTTNGETSKLFIITTVFILER